MFVCIWQDPYWHQLLWYCSDNNSYQGCALPEREEFADEDPTAAHCWNHEEEIPRSFQEDSWNQEPFQAENLKPVKDEDEWSDGWHL